MIDKIYVFDDIINLNYQTRIKDVLLGDGGPGDEENEAYGISHLKNVFGADTNWVQTSCNTYIDENGVSQHQEGKTPFRKRYASDAMKWYPDRQEFDFPS